MTGANRGLGFETARQLTLKGIHVVLGARTEAKAREAAARIQKLTGKEATGVGLDVRDPASIENAARFVEKTFGRLDILVNNAGVLVHEESAFNARIETLRETMETNVYGPFHLMQRLLPLMRKNGYGRVVNLSSGMGQLSEMNGGYPSYRVSKTAINALTRIFSEEAAEAGDVLVNSVCPGWVKTDMGGLGAELSVEEGADTIVWLATLPSGGPTGGFFRERQSIAW